MRPAICCRTFLGDFTPVSIKMAKEQNLSLNPTKISGLCDRLMCCLKYEQDNYEQTRKRMPRVGREIITPDGVGVINAINVLEETVRVRIAVGDSFELREYPIDDCQRPEREERKPRVEEEDPAIEDEQSAPQGERVEPAAQPAPQRKFEQRPPRAPRGDRPERPQRPERGPRPERPPRPERGPRAAQKTDGQAEQAGNSRSNRKHRSRRNSRFVNPNSRPVVGAKGGLKPSMCWRSARTRSGKTFFKIC